MKPMVPVVSWLAVILWTIFSFAAQAQPRYPVDPKYNWAVGAKPKLADELKKELDAGKILIIDVRAPEQFQKETIPGAINIPLEELQGHLKKLAKDTYIVFTSGSGRSSSQAAKLAEEMGFQSTTFCPVSQWKDQGYQAEPGNKN